MIVSLSTYIVYRFLKADEKCTLKAMSKKGRLVAKYYSLVFFWGGFFCS